MSDQRHSPRPKATRAPPGPSLSDKRMSPRTGLERQASGAKAISFRLAANEIPTGTW